MIYKECAYTQSVVVERLKLMRREQRQDGSKGGWTRCEDDLLYMEGRLLCIYTIRIIIHWCQRYEMRNVCESCLNVSGGVARLTFTFNFVRNQKQCFLFVKQMSI